jgi:hypothetical protein
MTEAWHPHAVWPRNHSNEVSAPDIVIGNATIANGDDGRGTGSYSCPRSRCSSAGVRRRTRGQGSEGAVEPPPTTYRLVRCSTSSRAAAGNAAMSCTQRSSRRTAHGSASGMAAIFRDER